MMNSRALILFHAFLVAAISFVMGLLWLGGKPSKNLPTTAHALVRKWDRQCRTVWLVALCLSYGLSILLATCEQSWLYVSNTFPSGRATTEVLLATLLINLLGHGAVFLLTYYSAYVHRGRALLLLHIVLGPLMYAQFAVTAMHQPAAFTAVAAGVFFWISCLQLYRANTKYRYRTMLYPAPENNH